LNELGSFGDTPQIFVHKILEFTGSEECSNNSFAVELGTKFQDRSFLVQLFRPREVRGPITEIESNPRTRIALPTSHCTIKLFFRTGSRDLSGCAEPVPHDAAEYVLLANLFIDNCLGFGANLWRHIFPSDQLNEQPVLFDALLIETKNRFRDAFSLFGHVSGRTEEQANDSDFACSCCAPRLILRRTLCGRYELRQGLDHSMAKIVRTGKDANDEVRSESLSKLLDLGLVGIDKLWRPRGVFSCQEHKQRLTALSGSFVVDFNPATPARGIDRTVTMADEKENSIGAIQ
jgi:hypothetical protein